MLLCHDLLATYAKWKNWRPSFYIFGEKHKNNEKPIKTYVVCFCLSISFELRRQAALDRSDKAYDHIENLSQIHIHIIHYLEQHTVLAITLHSSFVLPATPAIFTLDFIIHSVYKILLNKSLQCSNSHCSKWGIWMGG